MMFEMLEFGRGRVRCKMNVLKGGVVRNYNYLNG